MASDTSAIPGPATLVSIVVPAYNGLPFLIETIASVRRQTYANWELLICDNVSTDGTPGAVREELARSPDPRIRLITHEEHLPMAANWNRALACATGEFVRVLPADDILLPACLERQVALLQQYPEAGFASSGKEIIDADGKILWRRSPLREGLYDWAQLGPRSIRAVVNLLGEPAGVLFRRSLLDAGGYDPQFNYFIDVDLHLRFLRQSRFFFSTAPLYQFRLHSGSGSATSRERSVREYRLLLDKYSDDLGLGRRPGLRRWLEFKARLVTDLRSLFFWYHRKSL